MPGLFAGNLPRRWRAGTDHAGDAGDSVHPLLKRTPAPTAEPDENADRPTSGLFVGVYVSTGLPVGRTSAAQELPGGRCRFVILCVMMFLCSQGASEPEQFVRMFGLYRSWRWRRPDGFSAAGCTCFVLWRRPPVGNPYLLWCSATTSKTDWDGCDFAAVFCVGRCGSAVPVRAAIIVERPDCRRIGSDFGVMAAYAAVPCSGLCR